MAKRVQSPSSIKTYKQCPRKYYYQYIEKIPTGENVHTIRGNVAHSVLEYFFDQDVSMLREENASEIFRNEIQQLLVTEWKKAKQRFKKVGVSPAEEIQYFEETLLMLYKWLGHFNNKLKNLNEPLVDAFKHLTPVREQQYKSEEHQVRGFIDAIENVNGSVRVMDYKTSKSFTMDHHKLQLAIYSLLYYEQHNNLPDYVGVYFLKGPEKTLTVDMELIEYAKQEIAHVHTNTESEEKTEYPMKISRLCNWGKGQCDFYNHCFKNGKHKEPQEELITLKKDF